MTIIKEGFQSTDLDVPVVLPTLNLDFANSQKLDSRITFSRGSIGTFVNKKGLIETASANIPRFDYDPVTGECKGLLIEESRTNSLLRSEDFTTTWFTANASVQSNVITAPDGNTTADKLVENSSTGNKEVSQGSITFTSGTSLTFSCFVKAGERTLFRLAGTTGFFGSATNAFFNLTSGTVSFIQGGITSASIIPYPNGWYRCVATMLPTSSGTGNVYITLVISGVTSSYGGDGTSGIYIWGAQLEAAPFPTSYIPTVASTVTRSADTASMTGTNFSSWYNQNEGSIYCRYDRIGLGIPSISASTNVWTVVFDSESTTYMTLINGFASPSIRRFDVRTSGTFTSQQSLSSTEISNTFYRSAVSYKQDNIGLFFNGRNIASDRECSIPTVNKLNIGKQVADNTTLSGHISRLTYYPRSLSASQLQYLTQ